MPVVRWTTIVIESAVMLAVLERRICCSLNHGLLVLTTGVTVTPPVLPPPAFTTRVIAVGWVRLPLVPVTVTLAVPVVAVADAVKVRVLLAPVTEAGLKLAVTPLGSALVVRATAPAKPPVRATLIVLVTLAPWDTVTVDGAAASEKSGVAGGVTVRATDVVWVRLPLVPVTVTLAVPVVAAADAAKVSVLVAPVADAG